MRYAYGEFHFTPELQEEILQRLSEGETLLSICNDLRANDPECTYIFPMKVRKYARDHEKFGFRYEQAKKDGADAMADQALALADNPPTTEVITEKFEGRHGTKMVERTVRKQVAIEQVKLQVLVRQWRARTANPAYAPSTKVVGDDDSGPVRVKIEGGLPALPPNQATDAIPVLPVEDPPRDGH